MEQRTTAGTRATYNSAAGDAEPVLRTTSKRTPRAHFAARRVVDAGLTARPGEIPARAARGRVYLGLSLAFPVGAGFTRVNAGGPFVLRRDGPALLQDGFILRHACVLASNDQDVAGFRRRCGRCEEHGWRGHDGEPKELVQTESSRPCHGREPFLILPSRRARRRRPEDEAAL